jgi:hypothetical protein
MTTLNEVVQEAGWGGIEFTDAHVLHARQLRESDPDTIVALGKNIFSFYEGWRQPSSGSTTEYSSWRKANALKHILSALSFPTGPQTLISMQHIENNLKRPDRVPYILYAHPSGNIEEDKTKAQAFPGSRVQPTADLAAKWGTATPEELIEAYQVRGYGIELASFGSDRKGRNSDGDMRLAEYLEPLLDSGLVKGISISGSRPDFSNADPERVKIAEAEAEALLGRREAEFGKLPLDALFRALRTRRWEGNVTVRYPISAFRHFAGKVTLEKVIEEQRIINAVIQAQLPHITWQTLTAS